jgi:hypothetical protein
MAFGGKTPHHMADLVLGESTLVRERDLTVYHDALNRYIERTEQKTSRELRFSDDIKKSDPSLFAKGRFLLFVRKGLLRLFEAVQPRFHDVPRVRADALRRPVPPAQLQQALDRFRRKALAQFACGYAADDRVRRYVFVTTARAPTTAPSPICTPCRMTAS